MSQDPAASNSEGLHGVKRSLAVPGFALFDIVHPPNFRTGDHAHDRPQFSIVREGEFVEIVGGRRWKYEAGKVLFWAAGAVHCNLTGPLPARALVVQMDVVAVRGIECVLPMGWLPFVIHGSALGELPRQILEEFDGGDFLSRIALEGLLLEFLARASRHLARNGAPRWLDNVRRHVERHFRDRLDVSALARHTAVTAGEMRDEFRRFYGASPAAAVRSLRFAHASRLLRDTTIPIGDVAVESGYYDQAHLDREFRKLLSLTPAEYRLKKELGTETDASADLAWGIAERK